MRFVVVDFDSSEVEIGEVKCGSFREMYEEIKKDYEDDDGEYLVVYKECKDGDEIELDEGGRVEIVYKEIK